MTKPYLPQIAAALLAAAGVAFSQPAVTPAASAVAFEVASIKPAGPFDPAAILSGKRHVGMTVDNSRVDIGSASLMGLICQAYRVKPYQLTGLPDGAATALFDIVAKLPEGASQDQVPEMLQALLAERFKLAVHRETKEQPVYALVVAKSGPKLQDAPPEPGEPAPAAGADPPAPAKGEIALGGGNRIQVSRGGATITSKETGPVRFSMDNGAIDLEFQRMTMEVLTNTLSQYLDRPVVDMTGLKGAYQASLHVAMADMMAAAGKLGFRMPMAPQGPAGNPNALPAEAASDPSGGSIFTSVQQLGLKLEPRKQPYEFLVIDRLEKTPTEN